MKSAFLRLMQCLVLLLVPFAISAQQPSYELGMRSVATQLPFNDVLYSPDERYAAVSANTTIHLYDLTFRTELRRLNTTNPFFVLHAGMAAFDATSSHFYYSQGSSLQQCTLAIETVCQSIRNDVYGMFVINESNQIAYIEDDRPAIVSAAPNSKPVLFRQTIPAADLDDFTWSHVALTGTPGRNSQLVVGGSMDRDERVPGPNGRMNTVTRTEWRVSSFDAKTEASIATYVKVPLSVEGSTMLTDGRVLLCGVDQAQQDASTNAGDDDSLPMRYYDLSAGRYLPDAELVRVPKAFQSKCTNPSPSRPINPFLATAKDGPNIGHVSPSGNLLIGSGNNPQGIGQLLYLKHLSAPFTTHVLAGSVEQIFSISMAPSSLLMANGVYSNYIFDFSTGDVSYLPVNVTYALGVRGAFFFPEGPGPAPNFDLHYLNRDNSTTKSGLQLKEPPKWHGLSADASVLAYETSAIFRFANGVSSRLDCVPPPVSRYPLLDPSGTLLGAFCGLFDREFVVWDLATGKQVGTIPATGYDGAAAFSREKGKIVLAGARGLRVATLEKPGASDLLPDVPLTSSIVGVALPANPAVAVLAANDFNNGRGSLVWIDLTSGRTLDRIDYQARIDRIVAHEDGTVGVLGSDKILSVYSNGRKRLIQLIAAPGGDWLAFSEEGMFDGTAGGLQWAGFRRSKNGPLLSANLFFNELYAPGLLNAIARNAPPKLPAGITLETLLDLPGLKVFLQNNDIAPQVKNGTAVLCVTRQALFDRFRARRLSTEADADRECPRRVILSEQSNPASLVASLKALANTGFTTPWDNLKIASRPKTVHALSVAVSRYGRTELPDIPSAVPASRALQNAMIARSPGETVIDWATRGCGGPLEDSKATKAAILACLATMSRSVAPDDMVVLNFAGHGGTLGEGEMFYFYPHSPGKEVEHLSAAELADVLRRLPARRIVVIVDACDSGAVLSPLQQAAMAKTSTAARRRPSDASSNTVLDAQGVLLIAAASGLEPTKSTSTANPFLDKLARLFQGDALTSYSLAVEMRKPLESAAGSSVLRNQPLAVALGADFDLSTSVKR